MSTICQDLLDVNELSHKMICCQPSCYQCTSSIVENSEELGTQGCMVDSHMFSEPCNEDCQCHYCIASREAASIKCQHSIKFALEGLIVDLCKLGSAVLGPLLLDEIEELQTNDDINYLIVDPLSGGECEASRCGR